MARRSTRLTQAPTPNPKTKHKRAASGQLDDNPKRPKKEKSTPTKSQYFTEPHEERHSPSSAEGSVSEFGDARHDSDQSDVAETEDEDISQDDEPQPRKRSTGGKRANRRNSDTTGFGPGTEVIIKKPKARPAGKTPYTDETIHPNTLLFLRDLKANNNREWLKLHDPEFRQAEKDWHTFVEKMSETLIEIDDTIPELPIKDVIFRIYRDIRFSKDPTPYKAHFSVAWSRAGRKGPFSHYYLQIASGGNSFVGGGLWNPEAAPTAAMRRSIDRHPRRLKDVLRDAKIRKEFLSGASDSDAAAVKAFVKSNAESALKTRPKGFDAEHPDIALLRLRSYTMSCRLADDEVLGERGMKRIADLLAALKPFITFLNSVVMPDDDDDDDDEEGDGDGEEEDEQ